MAELVTAAEDLGLDADVDVDQLLREAERELDREVAAALVAAVLTARRLRAAHDALVEKLRDEWSNKEAELLADGGLC